MSDSDRHWIVTGLLITGLVLFIGVFVLIVDYFTY